MPNIIVYCEGDGEDVERTRLDAAALQGRYEHATFIDENTQLRLG